ncbi:c-type cytochrome [Desulfosporosinus youngiae]|uniref:Cytochrome c n=1 Tax=Desulfosporosinus youngiae DSM 17734 TaxID=768710 RepID=H5Y068_9FIRM|nr:c-type cytochrome [Desulfosporosinus youngiae]EHQ92047.1 Cytochrome c [Desulfosporosinus youngiae DSM 17734]
MKLRTFLLLGTLSFVLFVAITLVSSRLPSPMPESAVAGKLVWQRNNCVSCHTLFGHGGYEGDDLTHITAKVKSSYLINYLVQPPLMRPNKHTHHPSLNEEDAHNLVNYLEFVHTIPTLGWPPQPKNVEEDS